MNFKKLLAMVITALFTVFLTGYFVLKPTSSKLVESNKLAIGDTKLNEDSKTNSKKNNVSNYNINGLGKPDIRTEVGNSSSNNNSDNSNYGNSNSGNSNGTSGNNSGKNNNNDNSSEDNVEIPDDDTDGNSNNGETPNDNTDGNNNNGGDSDNSNDEVIVDESQWKLAWSDEFSGDTLDITKWSYDIGNCIVDADGNKVADGWGNNEKQYYTDSTNNVYLQDGILGIKAKEEKVTDQFGTELNYTSGKIKTLGKFAKKYGRIDVRAKLPQGKGFWPSIWMLPESDIYGGWAASGEIDIMESWGSKPDKVAGTIHYGATWPSNTYSGKEYDFPEGETVGSDFHTYSLEWEPGEIRWYVDGNLYQTQNNWFTKGINNEEKYSFPAPFDQNFYLILNLAIGGNWDGEPDTTTRFEDPMQVDYVRAYDLIGREYKTPVEPSVNVGELPADSKVTTADGNYIYNGDFKDNNIQENADGSKEFGAGWNFVHIPSAGGDGNVSIDTIDGTNYAKVEVTSPGSQDYSVQLIQLTTLGKGRWYKLSYDAKTDGSRNIGVKLSAGAEKGWSGYAGPYQENLTSEFKHFEHTFQMQKDSDIAARLEFELGLSLSPVWIGNVRVEEVSAPAVDYDATKAPLLDGNRIYNGKFDKGNIDRMTYWNFSTNAEATASVAESTRELNINIINGGAQSDAITLNQKGIQLSKDAEYKLTFKARAKNSRTIKVGILDKEGTIVYADDQIVNLSQSMDEHIVNFTMNNSTDPNSQVVFKLGGDNSEVYIDDVSLIQTSTSIDYSDVDLYPLKNGDFSSDLDSWSPVPNIGDGGDSTIIVEDGQAKISTRNVGPNPWSVMLNQEGLNLSKGIEYVVSFDVSATETRNMEVVVEDSTYTRYLSEVIEAPNGSEMKHYEYVLKMDKDQTVGLKFLMGKTDDTVSTSLNDIYIDNVKLEVKDAKFISSIVKNGRFDGTVDPWMSWTGDGGSADVSLTSDGVMKIAVNNVGPNSWSVQEFQQGLKFENGKKYSVSFKAKADEVRKMNVNIGKQLDSDPWYLAFVDTETVELSSTMKEYNFEFIMNQATDENGKIVFELGNITGGNAATNVYIDDVLINEVNN